MFKDFLVFFLKEHNFKKSKYIWLERGFGDGQFEQFEREFLSFGWQAEKEKK